MGSRRLHCVSRLCILQTFCVFWVRGERWCSVRHCETVAFVFSGVRLSYRPVCSSLSVQMPNSQIYWTAFQRSWGRDPRTSGGLPRGEGPMVACKAPIPRKIPTIEKDGREARIVEKSLPIRCSIRGRGCDFFYDSSPVVNLASIFKPSELSEVKGCFS